MIVIPRSDHSPLGPSSSKRWLNCPGSVNASVHANESPSAYAAEGTVAHYISEMARRENKPATHWLGQSFSADGHEFTIDKEFTDSVQEFVDWCEEQPGVPIIEQRVCFDRFVPGGFGTLDDGRLAERCVITDFKHGKGVQEYAEENTQLKLQALGVLQDYEHLFSFKEFELRICQPRLDHKDTWTCSTADLLRWAVAELPRALERVRAGRDFQAGEWCRFCRIKNNCAVRANSVFGMILNDFTSLEEVADLEERNVSLLKPEQLEKLAPLLPMVKSWIKDFERHLVATLISGVKIGSWGLAEGRSNRKWKDAAEAAAALEAQGVYPWDRKILSPKQAEDAGADVSDLTVKPPGKPVLVGPGDKRPRITGAALNDFTPITDDDDDY